MVGGRRNDIGVTQLNRDLRAFVVFSRYEIAPNCVTPMSSKEGRNDRAGCLHFRFLEWPLRGMGIIRLAVFSTRVGKPKSMLAGARTGAGSQYENTAFSRHDRAILHCSNLRQRVLRIPGWRGCWQLVWWVV